MSINISELIWTVICFFVLLVVLKKLLFDPLVSFMAARDARIAEPPHAVLAEDERCPYKSLVHDETIFLTANEPIRIFHKFR